MCSHNKQPGGAYCCPLWSVVFKQQEENKLLNWPESEAVVMLSGLCVPPVPGLGHGGVPWAHGARWRQLPDHPGSAAHRRHAGPGPDAATAALQAAGGQHDAQRHPEGPDLRCAALVRGDHTHTADQSEPVLDWRSAKSSLVLNQTTVNKKHFSAINKRIHLLLYVYYTFDSKNRLQPHWKLTSDHKGVQLKCIIFHIEENFSLVLIVQLWKATVVIVTDSITHSVTSATVELTKYSIQVQVLHCSKYRY